MYYLLNIIIVSAACYPGPILGHREKWSFRSKTNRDQLQLPQAKMSSVLLRQGLHIGGEIRSRLAIPLEYVRVIRDFYPTVTCAVVRQVRQGGKISFALCVTKTRTICQQESWPWGQRQTNSSNLFMHRCFFHSTSIFFVSNTNLVTRCECLTDLLALFQCSSPPDECEFSARSLIVRDRRKKTIYAIMYSRESIMGNRGFFPGRQQL